jgi:predicted AlkP superfamily phosphohydrolase/phosphomutase
VTDPDRKAELIPELRRIFSGAEGVTKIYGTEDFDEIGYPTASSQAPDLVLAASPDYMFSGESEGDYATPAEGGTHGYMNSDPQMQAIVVASGANIRKGERLGNISNVDVAPTIAALLGLPMEHTAGHAIPQIVGKQQFRRAK